MRGRRAVSAHVSPTRFGPRAGPAFFEPDRDRLAPRGRPPRSAAGAPPRPDPPARTARPGTAPGPGRWPRARSPRRADVGRIFRARWRVRARLSDRAGPGDRSRRTTTAAGPAPRGRYYPGSRGPCLLPVRTVPRLRDMKKEEMFGGTRGAKPGAE